MKIVKLILSLTIIAAVCAGVLASVNAVTKETIKGIRAQQTLDAAAAVMPPTVDATKVEALAEGVFVGKDASGKPAGYAVRGSDPSGYGGTSCSWSVSRRTTRLFPTASWRPPRRRDSA